MPTTLSPNKTLKSFRLAPQAILNLQAIRSQSGLTEAAAVEIALAALAAGLTRSIKMTLTEALAKYNASFHWNADDMTWCLSGTDKGNGWETDDYDADSKEQAESDAIEYLIEYNS